MSNTARNKIKSSWTPLTNVEANVKLYEERKELVVKWFEKWSDSQRKEVLVDLLSKCKARQLEFAASMVNQKKPVYKEDFTKTLPRVLSLYIISFLDPRSLCRCSLVCWYWKHLSELDQIWLPKCLRLGWMLPFTPSPYEVGVWKRLYVENIMTLKCIVPKQPQDVGVNLNNFKLLDPKDRSNTPRGKYATQKSGSKMPPWRGSDPVPKDIWRNNYLANDDDADKVTRLRKMHIYGPIADKIIQKAKTKLKTGQHQNNTLTRSKSSSGLAQEPIQADTDRPDWAKTNNPNIGAPFVQTADPVAELMDAAKRPAPVVQLKTSKTKSALKSARSARDPPSTNLFPSKPWNVQDDFDSDN